MHSHRAAAPICTSAFLACQAEDIMSNIESQGAKSYPLQHNPRTKQQVADAFKQLLSRIITRSGGDVLYDTDFLTDLVAWCIELSSLELKAARHVGATAAMTVGEAVVDKVLAEMRVLEGMKAQAGGSRKSRGTGLAIEVDVERVQGRITFLQEDILQPIMNGVFQHRYRDAHWEIRADMLRSLGVWMVQLPSEFLSNSSLKHFGWMLGDESAQVRRVCCEALAAVFSLPPAYAAELTEFYSRFKHVFMQTVWSTAPDVALAAFAMLSAAAGMGGDAWLSEADVQGVCEVMLCRAEPEVRDAAARLFVQCMPTFSEQAGAGPAAGAAPHGELGSPAMLTRFQVHHDQLLTLVEFVTAYMGAASDVLGYRLPEHAIAAQLQGGDALHEMTLVVQALYDVPGAEVLHNWEAMLSLVMVEGKDTGAETDIVMGRSDQYALLALLAAAAKASAATDVGRAGRVDKAVERARHHMAQLMCSALPALLDKYRGDATALVYVLRAASHVDVPGIPAEQPELFGSLLQKLSDIWRSATDGFVISATSRLLVSLCQAACPHSSQAVSEVHAMVRRDVEALLDLTGSGGTPGSKQRKRSRHGQEEGNGTRMQSLAGVLQRLSTLALGMNLGASVPELAAISEEGVQVRGALDSAITATMGSALATTASILRDMFSLSTALQAVRDVAAMQASGELAPAVRTVCGVLQAGFVLLEASFSWSFAGFQAAVQADANCLAGPSATQLSQLTDWREFLVDLAYNALTVPTPSTTGVEEGAAKQLVLTARLSSLKLLSDLTLHCRANMWACATHDIAWRPDEDMAREVHKAVSTLFSTPAVDLAAAMGLMRDGWFSIDRLAAQEPEHLPVPSSWQAGEAGAEGQLPPLISQADHEALGARAGEAAREILGEDQLDDADVVNLWCVFLPLAAMATYACNSEAQRLKADGVTLPRGAAFPDQKPPVEIAATVLSYDESKKAGIGPAAKVLAKTLKARDGGADLTDAIVAALQQREEDAFSLEEQLQGVLQAPELAAAAGKSAHKTALQQQAEAEEGILGVRDLVAGTAKRLVGLTGVGKVKGPLADALLGTLKRTVSTALAPKVDPDGRPLSPLGVDYLLLEGVKEVAVRLLTPANARKLKAYVQRAMAGWDDADRQEVFDLQAAVSDGTMGPGQAMSEAQAHVLPIAMLLHALTGRRGRERAGRVSNAASTAVSAPVPTEPSADLTADDGLLGVKPAPTSPATASQSAPADDPIDDDEADLVANVHAGPPRRVSRERAVRTSRTRLPIVDEASQETSATASGTKSSEPAAIPDTQSRRSRRRA